MKNSLKNYKKNDEQKKHLESIKCEQKSMIKNLKKKSTLCL